MNLEFLLERWVDLHFLWEINIRYLILLNSTLLSFSFVFETKILVFVACYEKIVLKFCFLFLIRRLRKVPNSYPKENIGEIKLRFIATIVPCQIKEDDFINDLVEKNKVSASWNKIYIKNSSLWSEKVLEKETHLISLSCQSVSLTKITKWMNGF